VEDILESRKISPSELHYKFHSKSENPIKSIFYPIDGTESRLCYSW